MAKVRSWVGLDVHARSVVVSIIDGESGELSTRRLSGVTSDVVGFCSSLPGPTRVAYEAGPTGFGPLGRWTRPEWGASLPRRGRLSGLQPTRSRPISATLSGCCGC
jgi:hypothetical protein